jgi:hypothetical protein
LQATVEAGDRGHPAAVDEDGPLFRRLEAAEEAEAGGVTERHLGAGDDGQLPERA